MSKLDADIVIVGAGMAGAATAFHLARLSAGRLLLLEQEETAGAHSSGRNAAIVREHADSPALQRMLQAGAAELRRGHLARFDSCGVMLVGPGDDEVSGHFERASGRGHWCPDDGTVDVAGLLGTYLAGQRVEFNTRVSGWAHDGRTLRIQTTRGEITTRLLVNAAGPWAGVLGNLPLIPMNRHLYVTGLLEWVDPSWPTVWDGQRGLYFRPESGGLLLCACDETPGDPGVYVEDPACLEDLAGKVAALQPGLGELAIRRSWVGQRTFAPDRSFVIGFDPRDASLFHVAALGGHGVTASSAVGELAAKLLTGGPASGAATFSPARLLPD